MRSHFQGFIESNTDLTDRILDFSIIFRYVKVNQI